MAVMYAQLIAGKIPSLCGSRGISGNKLAEMSGLDRSALDDVLSGRGGNPTAQTPRMTLAEFPDFPALNDNSFEDQPDDEGQMR